MAPSVGNVFNTLGKWSLTFNLIGLGLMFVVLFAGVAWAPVDYVLRRDDPQPTPLGDTLKLIAGLLAGMAVVALLAWLLYKSMTSTSTAARRFRQASAVGLLL